MIINYNSMCTKEGVINKFGFFSKYLYHFEIIFITICSFLYLSIVIFLFEGNFNIFKIIFYMSSSKNNTIILNVIFL